MGETVTLIDDSVLVVDRSLSLLSGKIILPEFSIRRLSNPKNYPTSLAARNAESACSFIEQLSHKYKERIKTGMPMEESNADTTLSIYIGKGEYSDREDNSKLIINVAEKLRNNGRCCVVIVSQNRALLVRARIAGYEARLYQASLDPKNFYTGNRILDAELIKSCDVDGNYSIYESDEIFFANECVTFLHATTGASLKTICNKKENHFALLQDSNHGLPVTPLNIEQEYAFGLLRNPNIDLVTLDGPYGTGKDLCALSYALAVKAVQKSIRIVLVPSSQPVGDYQHETLPGDLNEKNDPFMGPYIDTIRSLQRLTADNTHTKIYHLVKDGWEKMIKDGILEVAPLAYMRGRTFEHCVVIFTEAQNIDQTVMPLLISRMGENCKFIFTGDIAQLDTRFDFSLSGFTRLIDRLKDEELVGHIKLVDCVRSRGARLAAKL
ncbi:MAG: PhoH family protein [Candidatus Woesebacteria bacterium]|nr:PhoH family protein [Candidatus Woesebacteria bacterium]